MAHPAACGEGGVMRAEEFWRRILPAGGLAQRLTAAAVMLPVALLLIWAGGWVFLAAVALAGLLMLWELYRLPWPEALAPAERTHRPVPSGRMPERGALRREFAVVVAGLSVALLLAGFDAWPAAFAVLAAVAVAAAIVALATRRNPAWAAVRVAYIGLPCLSLAWLRTGFPQAEGLPALDGEVATFAILAIVWAADSLAFLFGRGIGGPRLAPRISPNKTWAGLFGAVVGGLAVGFLAALYLGLPPLLPAVLGGGLACIAQLGDLVASAVKRHYMVKDYSALIPGHGGLLDRLDGVIFVAPPGALLLWLVG